MKVIKRDGRAVEFNRKKIEIAIEKANTEVKDSDKATEKEIEEIIKYIEELDKRRILVEDIQDIIEQKLMDIKKFNLAKKYIVYRYTRALVRRQNTTDETILGIIKNANMQINNKENTDLPIIVPMQRDLIAGEVSKDLTKRILLPEKISKAHEQKILHFHNSEYFLQPMIDSCVVNLQDMLDNGTYINGISIKNPKTFQEACTYVIPIIMEIAGSQYGHQILQMKYLGKYIQGNKNQELQEGINQLCYQLYTTRTANGKFPNVIMILNNNYEEDDAEKIEQLFIEILKQKEQVKWNSQSGIKIVFEADENNKNKGNYNEILELAKQLEVKSDYVEVLSSKEIKEKYKLKYKFNQGTVTINLDKIGKEANGNEKELWKLLDERLELCREALMYKHYALLGIVADISPIHFRYGAIARLEQGEKIDKLLKGGYSTLSLKYTGLDELILQMQDCEQTELQSEKLKKEIIKFIKNKKAEWKKESGISFT